MRDFTDGEGRRWDIVIGRESWGAFVALFVPKRHDQDVRQAPLRAAAQDAADQELDAMHPHELQELFRRSVPKE
jgi:hypothetical protein